MQIKRIDHYCAHCGSRNVRIDAWAAWNIERQEWELAETFNHAHCRDCEGETSLRRTVLI